MRQLGNAGRLLSILTRGVEQLERKRVDEEMEPDDVTFRARRVVHRCWRESVHRDKGNVDVVEHVCPDFADICRGQG